MTVSLILGVLVGAVLGVTGAGGGILAVPALVIGLGWTMEQAVPVALIAVAGGAAVGATEGVRKGLVRYKAAIIMALAGVPFTSVGVLSAHNLPQRGLIGLFALVMVIVAVRLLQKSTPTLRKPSSDSPSLPPVRINPHSGKFEWTWTTAFILSAIGVVTGFLTGLLGVGGGFVIVPLLRKLTNASMHAIIATSLMVIALVGCGGIISAVAHGAALPFKETALFTLATICGMLLGRKLASHLPEHRVQQGFSLILIVVSLSMAGKAIFRF